MLGGQARRVADWRRLEAGDGRAEGSSALEDGGRAAVSLTPDADGTGFGSLESDAHSHR